MKPLRLHLDALVRIDPCHDFSRLFLAALDQMPRRTPTDLRVLCLAEPRNGAFFQSLAQDEIRLPGDRWRIAAWDPAGGVKIRHLPDHRDLWILAGRQIQTAESIHVNALFIDEPLEDGKPAAEIIRRIADRGGLAALPVPQEGWSRRHRATGRRLLDEFPPAELVLIDTPLSFAGWFGGGLVARARRSRRPVLAGSALQPRPGEEDLAGSWHCTLTIPRPEDPARLVAPLQAALVGGDADIHLAGRRHSLRTALRRIKEDPGPGSGGQRNPPPPRS